MTELEALRAEVAELRQQLKAIDNRTRPEPGPREMDLIARTPQHPVETWMDFLNRRRGIFLSQTGGNLRYVVERVPTGNTIHGTEEHVNTYLLEDGGSSNGLLDGHREPDEWNSVNNLKWRLRYWVAVEAEERRKWEDAYRTAKAMNDDSPATIEKLEADKAIIAEAVANQHALKQKICDLDPAVAERVRRQQQYGGSRSNRPSRPTSSVRWPPAARWAVERAVDRAAMWTTHPRLRATWRSWPGRCRNHNRPWTWTASR